MACCSSNTTSSCANPCGNTCKSRGGSGYLLLIDLYILLAIIVGSFIC